MTAASWVRLGCGLLIACGCGRSRSTRELHSGGAAGAASEGGAEAGAASAAGAGGARATGGRGQTSAGYGGATRASGGTSVSSSGSPGSGGRPSLGGADTGGEDSAAGDGGTGATAGAEEAGSAGAASDPDACAVIVRASSVTGALQAAIDAAKVPSTVCLEGGGYRGDVALRAGVNLRGGGWSSVICGTVTGDAATSRMTGLSDLQIEGTFAAAGNVKLSLQRLEINTYHTAICAPGSESVRITQNGAGTLELLIDGVTMGSPGVEITLMPGAERIDDSITIRNSRCDSTFQCYDFLRFTFDTEPALEAASGSRLALDVSNNVVRNIVLEGIVFQLQGGLSAPDAALSQVWFRHNTLASAGDLNSAIAFSPAPTLPVVLANNAIAYITSPVLNGDTSTITQSGNVFSEDQSSTSWFTDFALGDFSLSPNSPLIGAGTDMYGVATDITGKARVGGFDSGAYQH